ncbi:hypothetical protein AAG570_009294 [Ranatra chinensis]|uniref:Protein UXT n=1 Tax=Ranatra chinensis TaxID=642074 RepID=A0ABD0YNN9_9HEMI
MALQIPEKVLKYETFLNDVLKEELGRTHTKTDELNNELAEYEQLKVFIELIKDGKLGTTMKTQMDIGCNFYLQANIEDTSKILLGVGLGYFVEIPLDEALLVIDKRTTFLIKQLEIYRKRSADIKAHIKLVLLGLQELQKFK